jgi:hypothetical protein
MVTIQTEVRNGIPCRYLDAQRGIKIYLLPNVPMDAGEIQVETGFNLEKAVSMFPTKLKNRVRKIAQTYNGRQLDAISILLYAQERGCFENYAKRLESKPKDFEFIHPDLMQARTDVTSFFMRLYADLGIASKEEAKRSERQLRDYGAGVVVFPKRKS